MNVLRDPETMKMFEEFDPYEFILTRGWSLKKMKVALTALL